MGKTGDINHRKRNKSRKAAESSFGGSRGSVKAGKICSIAGYMLIILVILLCSLLVLPEIFGCHMYHVLSGSMEPAVPVGSLLYVYGRPPEDIEDEEIIAFYSSLEDGGVITHRVEKNNVVSGTFSTKGDANEEKDPTPVAYENYIGKVVLIVPYLGKFFTVMTSLYGKIAAACVIGLGVALNMIGTKIQ